MKRNLSIAVRIAVLAALLLTLAAAPTATSAKYRTAVLYNYESVIDPASGLYDWQNQMIKSSWFDPDPLPATRNKIHDWRGFDIVYTAPIVVTVGGYIANSAVGLGDHNATNSAQRNNDRGLQVVIQDIPAGWYAFQMKGASGGDGPNRDSTIGFDIDNNKGGRGGEGSTVSGVTYIPAGTLLIRAGRAGRSRVIGNNWSGVISTAQWGGGRPYGRGFSSSENRGGGGAGGGYSAIFHNPGSWSAADVDPGGTIVAMAGGGGGGGGAKSNRSENNKPGAQGGDGGYPWTGGGNLRGTGNTGGKGGKSDYRSPKTGGEGSGGAGGGSGGVIDGTDTAPKRGGYGGVISENISQWPYIGGGGGGGAGWVNDNNSNEFWENSGGDGGGDVVGRFYYNSTAGVVGTLPGGNACEGRDTTRTLVTSGGYLQHDNATFVAFQGGQGGGSDHNNYGGGGGGGGYRGGAGGNKYGSECSAAGGGGGSSYLWPYIYPLSWLHGNWKAILPYGESATIPDPSTGSGANGTTYATSAYTPNTFVHTNMGNNNVLSNSSRVNNHPGPRNFNGYVWIMYLGARSPWDPATDPGTDSFAVDYNNNAVHDWPEEYYLNRGYMGHNESAYYKFSPWD